MTQVTMTQEQPAENEWEVGSRFANLSTPWFTLIGEHIQAGDQPLDYWRIEKADSVIILPIQDNHLLLPAPTYRPGIGSKTLDFPGGRCPKDQDPAEAAQQTLQRELGIDATAIMSLQPINPQGWPVNSSFSNQKLYGFIAQLHPGPVPKQDRAYAIDVSPGIDRLRSELTCLQCRMVLWEWWYLRQTHPA